MPGTLAPDDVVRTHAEAARNEREPLLVLDPLVEFLKANGLDGPAAIGAEPIGDGHSCVTFALSTGVILRRPPRGPVPPSTHDVLREARLLRALEGTSVRVPRVMAVCEDPELIGAPFYVMEKIAGQPITDAVPPGLAGEQRRISEELIDALVELHSVDWEAVGLEDFGRPSGYLERQLRRFAGLWEANRTRDLPQVEEIHRWLAENLPESGPATIVHGDYRLGNTMYGPSAPARLAAILDWEMATIGDPLADVGYLMTHWIQPGEDHGIFTLQPVTATPGFPDRRELIDLYEARSGRSMRSLDWYGTLALWKTLVFMENNYKRAVDGLTDDPYLKSFGQGVIELADRAVGVIEHGL